MAALERTSPSEYHLAAADAIALGDVFLGPVRPVILALWVGVAGLLLVACGHVAHLLLLRTSERAQEIAIRTALGITRARLLRQFLTEACLLALVGGLAGLGLAWGAIRLVATEGPTQIPRLADATLDSDTLLAAAVLTCISALMFGVVPLRQVLRHADGLVLRSGTRGTDTAATWRARATLVALNVALAVTLLIGAGLLVRSLNGLLAVSGFGIHVQGQPSSNPESAPSADRFVVTPDYFDTLRIPLIRGRVLDDRDVQQGGTVACLIAAQRASRIDPITTLRD